MKRIVCFSGGHSSALVAVEVVRKYGRLDVVLLNHNIHPSREAPDIKRFKQEVADFLGLPITYANHPDWDTKNQVMVCLDRKAFQDSRHQAFCTYQLKTLPFQKWCKEHLEAGNAVIYYGFDANEKHRIQRRSSIIAEMGYKTDFPLALWNERTIKTTREIGIEPPNTYAIFKHANCLGCLKAGRQHWYIVYCNHPDIFEEAKNAEELIGHSIINGIFMEELEPFFASMKAAGLTTTEHEAGVSFFARAKRWLKENGEAAKPCECTE